MRLRLMRALACHHGRCPVSKLRAIASGGVFDGAELSLAQLSEEAAPAIFDLCRCERAHTTAAVAAFAAAAAAARTVLTLHRHH